MRYIQEADVMSLHKPEVYCVERRTLCNEVIYKFCLHGNKFLEQIQRENCRICNSSGKSGKQKWNPKKFGCFRSPSMQETNIEKEIIFSLSSPQCIIIYRHYIYYIRRPFEKFVDSSYYSESELCGGAVTVSFSKYIPWQATHFLQCYTHFSKTCCRQFAESFRRSLGAPFSWLEKPRNLTWRDLGCMAETDWKVDRRNPIRTSAIQPRSRTMRFLGFSNHIKCSSEARNFDVTNGLQHVFKKWVERCKKCIAC
jgi:hypothetical protein